jgi:hypothetical protein
MDDYESGTWNAICARCGFKYKAYQLRMEHTGLRVCSGADTNGCWEPRSSQVYVKARVDKQTPPWTQPEAADVFVTPGPPDVDAL